MLVDESVFLASDKDAFVNFVEQWWHSHDKINEKIPNNETIRSGLARQNNKVNERPVADPDKTEGYWDQGKVGRFLQSRSINEALERRGIILADLSLLRPEQLAAANAVLDFSDHRSQKAKLNELGISTTQYNGWLKLGAFQRYVKQRAEALLGDVQHEAHSALLKNVQRGDLNSIKLYYELTGRWSSKTVGDLNVEFLIIKVIEAVQKHVKDPAEIQAVAGELNSLLNGVNQPTSNQPPPVEPSYGQRRAGEIPMAVTAIQGRAIENKELPKEEPAPPLF